MIFYSVDTRETQTQGLVLLLDFSNPSITLFISDNSGPAKLHLEPSKIILHVEPRFTTRCVDSYSLVEIVCFAYLFASKKQRNFATKKGMLANFNQLDLKNIERTIKIYFS